MYKITLGNRHWTRAGSFRFLFSKFYKISIDIPILFNINIIFDHSTTNSPISIGGKAFSCKQNMSNYHLQTELFQRTFYSKVCNFISQQQGGKHAIPYNQPRSNFREGVYFPFFVRRDQLQVFGLSGSFLSKIFVREAPEYCANVTVSEKLGFCRNTDYHTD